MTPAIADMSARLAALLNGSVSPAVPNAVVHGPELDRVLGLPRRTWREDSPEVVRLMLEMSAWLRRPGTTVTLRPIQAFALAELFHMRGLFGPMRVGSGKTLITFLAASVMLDVKRPLLLIPAKLRKKTYSEFERLATVWRAPPSLRIVSYEELSRDYGAHTCVTVEGLPLAGGVSKELVEAAAEHPKKPVHAYYFPNDGKWYPCAPDAIAVSNAVPVYIRELGLLDLADPDLVMGDEIHRLKNIRAACTRKTERFMRGHPLVPVVGLSGTITKDKIQDYAHILTWILKSYAPVPRTYSSIQEWGNALNVKVADEDRMDVGALIELASPEDLKNTDLVTAARRGFRRRLIETPGVVAYAKQYDGASLLIEETAEPDYSAKTEEDFKKLRLDNVRPDDSTLPDGLAVWAYARQRALGFYYIEDPPAPMPWKNARTEWHATVRAVLKHGGQRGIDSEWQVANACVQDPRKFPGAMWDDARRCYAAWKTIEPTFVPKRRAVWCDDAAIKFVASWIAAHRGLVWTEQVEFAERLARETGAPYFGQQGRDATGLYVEDARPAKHGSIILSIESNSEGRNLQEHWSDNLLTMLPKGGDKFEQTLGRTHRENQHADEVTCGIMIPCRESGQAWLKILETSRYIVDSTMEIEEGAPLPAKVFYADVDMPDEAELALRGARSARY